MLGVGLGLTCCVVGSAIAATPVGFWERVVDKPYMHLPVRNGAPKRLIRWIVDDTLAREFEIELAEGEPDFWTYTEVKTYMGKTLRLEVDPFPKDDTWVNTVTLSNRWPEMDTLYRERLRPQFHFSPSRGWMNDPNGLVYYDGEYHLFFQHNPYGRQWGNMTWGHAVSEDMIHWRQLPDAIHPDKLGTIFSGSAVVDHRNTTGWQKDRHKPIVAIYTSAGGSNVQSRDQPFTQSIAYSTDRGRSFTPYQGNPVLGHIEASNRDPKVLWHEPTGKWVMILYLDRSRFGLFGSLDLKNWSQMSEVWMPDGHECPDLFELPVDGDPKNTRWVVWEAAGRYLIGDFDGQTFTPESELLESRFGANDYAGQTFSNMPSEDGRRIQIAWMSGGIYPGMPFNQQMTVPRVLSLRSTRDGVRLFIEPVKEIERLRGLENRMDDLTLGESPRKIQGVQGDLFDIELELEIGDSERLGLDVRGHRIEFLSGTNELTALDRVVTLKPEDGRILLRLLVDRTSVEVFANRGRVQMASCFLPADEESGLSLYALGGAAKATSVTVWELRSIWNLE